MNVREPRVFLKGVISHLILTPFPSQFPIPNSVPGPLPWCRFDDLYGIIGRAGDGAVAFSINGLLAANSATLHIYGLGIYDVENLACGGNNCSGLITGLPFGFDPLLYSGKLVINEGERVCTAPGLLVPPPPMP